MKKLSKINPYQGIDFKGYLGNNHEWWRDPNKNFSYKIFDPNFLYPSQYFSKDQVPKEVVDSMIALIRFYYKQITGLKVKSILDMGCGGGWFLKGYIDFGLDAIGIEGSKAGYFSSVKRGVSRKRIFNKDLRDTVDLEKKFDVVVCTEVAEHIETPFSSKLVENLARHGDIIFFSFQEDWMNEASIHHPNNQPPEFWKNIFLYFGFEMAKLPKDYYDVTRRRAEYIVYNKQNIKIPKKLRLEILR